MPMSESRTTSKRSSLPLEGSKRSSIEASESSKISNRELLSIALLETNPVHSEALFNRATPFIQQVALRHMYFHFPSIQGFDRDAIIQDTLIRVWEGKWGFKPANDSAGFVGMMTRFCAVDYLRRLHTRRSQGTLSLNLLDGDLIGMSLATPESHDPAIILECDDTARATQGQIDAFIEQLSPADQALVQMQIDDASYREMARSLGLPLGTVKTRLFNVRRRLRKYLGQDAE
jgi:RNA polymerase sigma factor (sigma-70 family)